jgi:hypothetical protein
MARLITRAGSSLALFVVILCLLLGTRAAVAQEPPPLWYSFNGWEGELQEAGSMAESPSSYMWISSGAYFFQQDGIGSTVQFRLPESDRWREGYAGANPVDTDGGFHPQNIFRLVWKQQRQEVDHEAYFRIVRDNLNDSPNRNASNGLLLMTRYLDSQNLYYGGVRVDGYAVIKRKRFGSYTTLASRKIYSGTYDRSTNPNLLPKQTWIGVRMVVTSGASGPVLNLYVDNGRTGTWAWACGATDTSSSAVTQAGHTGLRTDFMDVEFDDYKSA